MITLIATQSTPKNDIVNIINFLIENIFIGFGGRICQKTVGIPMETNCAPFLVDLFLYPYEADFVQELKGKKKLAQSFNFTFRYIDDVLSQQFSHVIYPAELVV